MGTDSSSQLRGWSGHPFRRLNGQQGLFERLKVWDKRKHTNLKNKHKKLENMFLIYFIYIYIYILLLLLLFFFFYFITKLDIKKGYLQTFKGSPACSILEKVSLTPCTCYSCPTSCSTSSCTSNSQSSYSRSSPCPCFAPWLGWGHGGSSPKQPPSLRASKVASIHLAPQTGAQLLHVVLCPTIQS